MDIFNIIIYFFVTYFINEFSDFLGHKRMRILRFS